MAVDPQSYPVDEVIVILLEGQRQHGERLTTMDDRMDRIENKLDLVMWLLVGVIGTLIAILVAILTIL